MHRERLITAHTRVCQEGIKEVNSPILSAEEKTEISSKILGIEHKTEIQLDVLSESVSTAITLLSS